MTFFASASRYTTELVAGRNQEAQRCGRFGLLSLLLFASAGASYAQSPATIVAPIKSPPKMWVDKDTGHRVIRLTDEPGSKGLYFDKQAYTPDGLDMIYTSPLGIHDLKIRTFQSELLVGGNVGGAIVGTKTRRVFYENLTDGRYYVIDIDTKLVTQLPRLPLRGHLTTVNADETLLGGTYLEGTGPELDQYRLKNSLALKPARDEALKATLAANAATKSAAESLGEAVQAVSNANAAATVSRDWNASTPSLNTAQSKLDEAKSEQLGVASLGADANAKSASTRALVKSAEADAVQQRFDAHEPEDLFTLNLQTGEIKVLHKGRDWLNHVEFSPTDPGLLMYDHEGPALSVDRVWTIRTDGSHNMLMQKRTGTTGIATHEFWSHDGGTVWFDLQEAKGQDFSVAGVSLATGEKTTYRLTRQEASIHYNISPDGSLFCGDGNLMAHGEVGVNGHRTLDRAWIELLRPNSDGTFHSTRLAHITANNYERTEPNPRFSPDGKLVIFTSNMYGYNYIFAVEVARAPATAAASVKTETARNTPGGAR